jgi:hypothetical protein
VRSNKIFPVTTFVATKARVVDTLVINRLKNADKCNLYLQCFCIKNSCRHMWRMAAMLDNAALVSVTRSNEETFALNNLERLGTDMQCP